MHEIKKIFSSKEYIKCFNEYVNNYCMSFFGVDVSCNNMGKIFDIATKTENQRYRYPLYFLWLIDADIKKFYIKNNHEYYILYGSRVLLNMTQHIDYNDYNMMQFFSILDKKHKIRKNADKFYKLNVPYNILNDELYSFMWQCVVQFKLKFNLYGDRCGYY